MSKRSVLTFALVAGTAMAALSQPAATADEGGSFLVHGAGMASCQMYVEATAEQRLHAETWWAGYTTAMNRVTDDNYDLLGERDFADANAWLEAWCGDNPEAFYVHAVHQMLESFYPDRTRRAP
ncbi:MAG: hypothetical protein JJT95_05890 [Pararhodobacter sp.]|nr:hypothetical protein [Pararhodobacter sp.]